MQWAEAGRAHGRSQAGARSARGLSPDPDRPADYSSLAKGWVTGVNADAMTLVNGKERLTLRFDCKKCEMHVVGRMKKGRSIAIKAA